MLFRRKMNPAKIKTVNTRKLHAMGIDVIEHLPMLEEPEFREPEKIARRMMVLLALFQLHLKAPNEIVKQWLEDNGLMGELTENELTYLGTKYSNLSQQSQTDIYWFVEAIWTFAWVGGLHDTLTFNTGVENSLVTLVPNIQHNEPTAKFISDFSLRKQVDIFDMLDKFYRAHWFARNNSLTGKTSDQVDIDIIMERRKALEYVVYKKYEWDDISLDT